MMTGDADLQSVTAGATVLVDGLGLWPEAIVDQHFLKRQRTNRLLSAGLDHPDLLGVGIDEGPAVVVTGDRFEAIGRSNVVVIDARHASVPGSVKGSVSAGSDLKLSVLRDGMSFSLK
jgi:cyanophycinase